jgi:hypothetical protein
MGQYHRHARLTRQKQPALLLLREQGWTLQSLTEHWDVPYNEVRRVLYGESRPSTYLRSRLVELTGRNVAELLDEGSLPPKRASERCDCDRCTLARARRAEAAGVLLMTAEELTAWVAASRAAQGLPATITDAAVLARAAAALRPAGGAQ